MESEQIFFVGVVMGWELDPANSCYGTFSETPPVVTEFYPGGNTETGAINPTPRMRELAAAGFHPVAIVRRDFSRRDGHYLFAHNGISKAIHMELLENAEAIFRTAAVATEHPADLEPRISCLGRLPEDSLPGSALG
ncbi:MAG TPA: hypothetical protein VHU89_01970 [Acidobacteriaceae bacterium]|jgi:hypothetical protein|nr:hypothetical protein [Acidobacteriaceae bacterium]